VVTVTNQLGSVGKATTDAVLAHLLYRQGDHARLASLQAKLAATA